MGSEEILEDRVTRGSLEIQASDLHLEAQVHQDFQASLVTTEDLGTQAQMVQSALRGSEATTAASVRQQ